MRFITTAAELNARDQIVMSQPARTNAYYEKALETCDVMHRQERAKILKEWKESGTWKDKYATWGAACEIAAGLSRSHVNNLIADLSLETAGRQAVEEEKDKRNTSKKISNLPDPNKEESEEKPAVHAATPEQMARTKPKSEPESDKPPMDASGAVIPQHLLPLRDRRQEVTDAEYHASKLGSLLENLQSNGKDPLWAHLMATGSLQTYAHSAKTIRHNLAECLPDVVCPQCEGNGKTKPQANAFVTCSYCCGSGWISEVRWNRDYVKSHDSQKLSIVAKRNGKA